MEESEKNKKMPNTYCERHGEERERAAKGKVKLVQEVWGRETLNRAVSSGRSGKKSAFPLRAIAVRRKTL